MPVAGRWLVALAAVASTARADMVQLPNIVVQCHGPATWDALAKCVDQAHEGFKLPAHPTAKLAFASNGKSDRYLFFQRNDGQWALATQLYDNRFEVEQPRSIRIGRSDGVWIDLHHVDSNGIDLVLQRSALICPSAKSCSQVMYECTHVSRGRTRETFRGKVNVGDDGQISVVGDRTQSGFRC